MKLDDTGESSKNFLPGSLVYWCLDAECRDQWVGPMLITGLEDGQFENGVRFSLWDPQTREKFYAWSYELTHLNDSEGLEIIEPE
jgi:hypothetical protein